MRPLDISKMEKGEATHLLSDDAVKPIHAERERKTFSWTRCLIKTTLIALAVLFAILTATAVGAYCWTRHQVRRFTVPGKEEHLPNPPLPVSPVPDAALEVFKDKSKLFWDQLRAGMAPPEDFVVTQEELNGIIASSDFLRGHAYVTLSENKWHTELVLPANKLPGGKGRFFIGHGLITTEQDSSAQVNRVMTQLTPKHPVPGLDFANILLGKYLVYHNAANDGTLTAELDYGQFFNWVAPQDWIARRENLLSCDTYDDDSSDDSSDDDDDFSDEDCQEFMDTIARIESISLQDGKIVFSPVRDAVADTGDKDGGHRRLLTKDTDKASSWPGTYMFRRALRAAF